MTIIKLHHITLFTILVFIVNVSYSKEEYTSFYIPSTISDEAKAVLKTFKREHRDIRKLPKGDDVSGWNSLKNKYIGYVRDINKKTITDFNPSIEELTIAGVSVTQITPSTWKKDNRLIIYIHGGAYTLFTSKSSLYNILPLSHYSGIRVISINYTTAPNKKWAGILNEVTEVIIQLNKNGYRYESIGIIGDSAGGGLAVSSILKLRDTGHSLPNAVALWSPWTDVSETGDTYQTLKEAEPTFIYDSLLAHSADAYAEHKDFKNPYVSPVYADFNKGFPSTLIQGGTKELLLSNFIRIYQNMDISGVEVKLDLYEGMWHVFQSHYNLPESKLAIQKTAKYFNANLIPEK